METGRRLSHAVSIVLLVAVVVSAYAGSLHGPFVFDDGPSIVDNPSIRHLWPIWKAFETPGGASTLAGRPFLNFTFALNYGLGGLRVGGYHVLNLAIHLGAALALFGIVRRTLERRTRGALGIRGSLFALSAALLWAVHPLQTESVTYVVQRAESLMGLCYLLTLYGFIRGSDPSSGRPRVWFAFSWVACLAGMATKEVMVSAPLIVFLYDRTFSAGSFTQAWRLRRGYYGALALTWIPLAALVISSGGNRAGSIGFGLPISWPAYEWTQFAAVSRYLKLAFWPVGLVFDYEAFSAGRWPGILPEAVVVAGLGAGTIWALMRRPALGFLGAWFFIILAPTSLVPGVSQMIAEHRMYLPLAAVIVAALLGLERLLARHPAIWMGLAAGAVAGAATATFARNQVYRTDVALWADTAAKRPENPAAFEALGDCLARSGRSDQAVDCYERALQLRPLSADLRVNLGAILAETGKLPRAVEELKEATRLSPNSASAHQNLGMALKAQGHPSDALAEFEEAVRLNPDDARAEYALANALDDAGRAAEAIPHFRRSLSLDPGFSSAHYDLAVVLQGMGRFQEASQEFEETLKINPANAVARNNLAVITAQSGRMDLAVEEWRKAIASDPNYAPAHSNLGLALRALGRENEAQSEFEKARRLQSPAR